MLQADSPEHPINVVSQSQNRLQVRVLGVDDRVLSQDVESNLLSDVAEANLARSISWWSCTLHLLGYANIPPWCHGGAVLGRGNRCGASAGLGWKQEHELLLVSAGSEGRGGSTGTGWKKSRLSASAEEVLAGGSWSWLLGMSSNDVDPGSRAVGAKV